MRPGFGAGAGYGLHGHVSLGPSLSLPSRQLRTVPPYAEASGLAPARFVSGQASLMRRLGMGLVGPGFVGAHHVDAVRRLGFVDVVAVAASSQESARRKADALGIPKAYGSYQELIADPAVHVVHNT